MKKYKSIIITAGTMLCLSASFFIPVALASGNTAVSNSNSNSGTIVAAQSRLVDADSMDQTPVIADIQNNNNQNPLPVSSKNYPYLLLGVSISFLALLLLYFMVANSKKLKIDERELYTIRSLFGVKHR